MDSLKSLLDEKKYDLVIKLTEKSEIPADFFYRFCAFLYLGKYEEALLVIQDHQSEMEKHNLSALVKAHIEILCILGRYEQAYSALDYYSNLPYESQVVEEVLRKMPQVIAEEESKKNAIKTFSEDEVIDKLNSYSDEDMIFALDLVKKLDIFTYLDEVAAILTKDCSQHVRSFALMLLVDKEVDREFDYLSFNGLIKVNPKKLHNPFTGMVFNSILRRMDYEFKNSTISENGLQILSTYAIYTYPHPIENDEDELLGAIYLYCLFLLKDNSVTLDDYAVIHNLDKDKIKYYFELLDTASKDIE